MSGPSRLAQEPELSVTLLTKRFGGVLAVSDLSLTVRCGQIHGLIGPNGAGKSTAIALISGFLRPDEGQITFGSHDLIRLDTAAIARLGVVRTFQQAAPLPGLTVLENVLTGMHMHHRSGIVSILARAAAMRREAREFTATAHALLRRFGLDTEKDMQSGTLTFGKLRFLEIARAMAMRPRILLLDEPAAGLNQPETERLAATIRDLRQDGTGILLIDHDVPFVFDLCDEVTVMDSGRVIASGDPASVYADPAVRQAYLGTDADTADETSKRAACS